MDVESAPLWLPREEHSPLLLAVVDPRVPQGLLFSFKMINSRIDFLIRWWPLSPSASPRNCQGVLL